MGLLAALPVPATLHASLMARLDRLGHPQRRSRRSARCSVASSLMSSSSRWRSVLRKNCKPDSISSARPSSCSVEVWFRTPRYLFGTRLVLEDPSTLLRGRRRICTRAWHRRCEIISWDLWNARPELLASPHCAGDTERAVDQWLKAGRHAAAQFTYLEAIVHSERASAYLFVTGKFQPGRREMELQLALGLCLFATEGGAEAKPPYACMNWRRAAATRTSSSRRSTECGEHTVRGGRYMGARGIG